MYFRCFPQHREQFSIYYYWHPGYLLKPKHSILAYLNYITHADWLKKGNKRVIRWRFQKYKFSSFEALMILKAREHLLNWSPLTISFPTTQKSSRYYLKPCVDLYGLNSFYESLIYLWPMSVIKPKGQKPGDQVDNDRDISYSMGDKYWESCVFRVMHWWRLDVSVSCNIKK